MLRALGLAAVTIILFGGPAQAVVQSPYSAPIDEILKSWPPKTRKNPPPSSHPRIQCYRTPGNDFFIGIAQWMTLNAPLEEVTKVLDDFTKYTELFGGLEEVSVVSRDGNHVETRWEQRVPLFFIPNVKYRLSYRVDTSVPGRKVYRYQLIERGRLVQDDGMIVVESIGPNTTWFTEMDFWDAEWGIAKTLVPQRIWRDSVQGIVTSNLAVLNKSENPTWSHSKAQEEAVKAVDTSVVEACLKNKSQFSRDEYLR